MLKPSIQLRFGQSLSMTPQLQQAIKLLQLSSVELQQEIQQLFETNPMLEKMKAMTFRPMLITMMLRTTPMMDWSKIRKYRNSRSKSVMN